LRRRGQRRSDYFDVLAALTSADDGRAMVAADGRSIQPVVPQLIKPSVPALDTAGRQLVAENQKLD
jgi:hypothetical protein